MSNFEVTYLAGVVFLLKTVHAKSKTLLGFCFPQIKGDKSTDLLQTGKVKPSSRQDKDLKLFGQKPTLPLNYISYGIVLGCKSGRTATEARTCY